MSFLLFIASILVGALGVVLLLITPLQGIVGAVLLVLAGVLLVGAAIVDRLARIERLLEKP